MAPTPEAGAAPRAEPALVGIARKRKRREPGLRERLFARWLGTAQAGELFAYHRGELALDADRDPDLAAMATAVRDASTGSFAEVSECGHERGRTIGAGLVELITRRERGEMVYLARKRT